MTQQEIQKLVQQEVQKQMSSLTLGNNPQFAKALDAYVSRKTYLLPKVVPHKHDGVDNIRIPRSSVINSAASAFIQVVPPNGPTTISSGIVNPSQIYFDGIAYDGVSDILLQNYVPYGSSSIGSTAAVLVTPWSIGTVTQSVDFTAVDGTGIETRAVTFTHGSLTISWTDPLINNDSLTIQIVSATHKATVTGYAQLGLTYVLTNSGYKQQKNGIFQTNTHTLFDDSLGSWVPFVGVDSINLATVNDSSGNLIASIQVTDFSRTTITITTFLTSGYIFKGSLAII